MAGKSKSEAPPFSHELRVRYGECDAQGIVFNANFLAYVDVVLTEIWRQSMGSYDLLLETGVDTVVGEANMRFLSPGRFDDILRIEAGFDGLGTTSTTLKLWFRRDDRAPRRSRHPLRLRRPGELAESRDPRRGPPGPRAAAAPLRAAHRPGSPEARGTPERTSTLL